MSNLKLTISESSLNGVLLAHRVQGGEDMNSSFSYAVQCHTLKDEVKPADLVGKKACLVVTDNASQNQRIINGIISQFSFISTTSSATKLYYNYELTIESALCLLDHSIHSKVFQDKTVDQIVTQICNDKSVNLKVGKIEQQPEYKKSYSIQYKESDFYFISRIIKEVGLFFFFTHQEHDHTLFLSNTHLDYLKIPDFNESALSFISKPNFKIGINKISVSNFDFDAAKQVKTSVEKIESFVKESLPFHLFQDTENQKFSPQFDANLLKETLLATQNTHVCETTDILFRPGYYFTLKSGDGFVITSSSFFAEDGTHLAHGSHFKTHTSFRCTNRLKEYRGEETFPAPKIYGPLTAKVASEGGSGAVDTDKHGRVCIKFPWDESENKYSLRVRVTQPWAGSNQGFQFIPHVGDEVLVSFLNGDPEEPIITGSLYSSNNKSNFTPKDKPMVQGLVTKSNNSLLFTDDAGKEHVQVGAKKDFSLVAQDSSNFEQKSLTMKADQKINITGPAQTQINIDEQGNITIGKSSGSIAMSASGEFKIVAPNGITMQGDLNVIGEITGAKNLKTLGNILATGDVHGANI